ncbi:MAG: peptidoglycan editing factor PgeF [Candidatus Omnitrophica bacterium]|jgi:conserved hypothetical protein TIGR00726|nr:peptidoglycan editing factor PgeF [Candidatus Omnitrophota bacterium]
MTGNAAGFSDLSSVPLHSKNGSISFTATAGYYRISFATAPDIICAFSTRARNYDLRAASETMPLSVIQEARREFFGALGIAPGQAVFLEQVHGANVLRIEAEQRGRGVFDWGGAMPRSDAVITGQSDTALCLLTADCLPIVLIAPRAKALGAVHAGWRGTHQKIAGHAVDEMVAALQVKPKELLAVIGPGIRPCCYAVSAEMQRNFPRSTLTRNNAVFLDLVTENVRQLLSRGVRQENIVDTGVCSYCNRGTFFSYRAGDIMQRMLTVIMRKESISDSGAIG